MDDNNINSNEQNNIDSEKNNLSNSGKNDTSINSTITIEEDHEFEKHDSTFKSDEYLFGNETVELEPEKYKIPDSFKQKPRETNLVLYIFMIGLVMFIGGLLIGSSFGNLNSKEAEITEPKTITQTEIVYRDKNDLSDIVENVMPSTVSITSTVNYQQFNFFTGMQSYEVPSSGSGIIIEKNNDTLYIATNNHVIEDSKDLTVEFVDGTAATASVNGTSSDSDIAVITVKLSDISEDTLKKIKVASLYTNDDLKVGNQVIAIGNALGYGQSVTVGYISALDRSIETEDGQVNGLIQTDAAINPGNSGGALINMNGEVIGINVAKYASTEVEGVGYSIPISKVQDLINMLSKEKYDETERGYLGIQCSTIDNETAYMYDMPQGVYVFKITNQKLIEDGLVEKDIITSIDGHAVTTVNSLTSLLEYYQKGSEVPLIIKRLEDGKYVEKEIKVALVSLEETKKAE